MIIALIAVIAYIGIVMFIGRFASHKWNPDRGAGPTLDLMQFDDEVDSDGQPWDV